MKFYINSGIPGVPHKEIDCPDGIVAISADGNSVYRIDITADGSILIRQVGSNIEPITTKCLARNTISIK